MDKCPYLMLRKMGLTMQERFVDPDGFTVFHTLDLSQPGKGFDLNTLSIV